MKNRNFSVFLLLLSLLLFAAVPCWAETVTFDIKGYRIDGPELLDAARVERLLAPFIGQNKTIEDARAATQALTAEYARAGHGLMRVSLPAQEAKDGILTLKVDPVLIENIHVKGNQYHDEANILAGVPALKTGGGIDTPLLAKQLRLSNENFSKQTSVTLTPLKNGNVDADVAVTDSVPYKAYTFWDNSGTRQSGISRVSVGLQYANLWNLDHTLTAQYTTSPNNYGGVQIYGLGYQIPIHAWGDAIDLYAGKSKVSSGTLNNLFSITGSGDYYGVRFTQNFANRGYYKDKFVYSLDIRDVKPSIQFGTVDLAHPISLRPGSITYSGSYLDPGNLEANFYLTAVANFPGLQNGQLKDFRANRHASDDNYRILRVGASINKGLPAGWMARANISGQYTRDLLVSAEQFGTGGADGVRGFDEREVANDKGVQLGLEVYTPDLFAGHDFKFGTQSVSARLLGFVDHAEVWRNQPLPSEVREETVASIGLGLRLSVGSHASLKLDCARVTNGTRETPSGSNDVHAAIVLSM